jgi:hypothetical protein
MASLAVILKKGENVLIKGRGWGGERNRGEGEAGKHYTHAVNPPVLHQYTMICVVFVPSIFPPEIAGKSGKTRKITPHMHLTALISSEDYL